jgi:hypothetical protein
MGFLSIGMIIVKNSEKRKKYWHFGCPLKLNGA